MNYGHTLSFACLLLLSCSQQTAFCGPGSIDKNSPLVSGHTCSSRYYKIHVIDADTGRGVPMVQLSTVNDITYFTDSNGFIAFYEPGLMGQTVFFYIQSHGYSFPKDGFGYRGMKLQVEEGGSCEIKIQRINLAERLYRVTGQGIYRDSVLLGEKAPLKKPLLNGGVMGQDTVMALPFKGKIYWFWGDTNCVFYPLGNFAVSGAVSDPEGLDPDRGVDLEYFVGKNGFSKKMCPRPGPGPVWLEGLMILKDSMGEERLFVQFMRMKDLGTVLERGLAIFDEKKKVFKKCVDFDLSSRVYPRGHPFKAESDGIEYYYFGHPHPSPFPNVRVRAELKYVSDPSCYEVFTCFKPGAAYDSQNPDLERDSSGNLIYGWKKNSAPVNTARQSELVKNGKISQSEGWLQLQDVKNGELIQVHAGSVFWNRYRKKWILIGEQAWGKPSLIGEIYYAEADNMTGPWVYAKKIVTHDDYSFYNPTQHPFFDKDGGRRIYFEGTYTRTFSSGRVPKTPRYDYNQVMYGLNLDDPGLFLPCPVYSIQNRDGEKEDVKNDLLFGEQIRTRGLWKKVFDIPFFAFPPDRRTKGLVPVYAERKNSYLVLSTKKLSKALGAKPFFYALPASASGGLPASAYSGSPGGASAGSRASASTGSPSIVPLFEYKNKKTGGCFFSTKRDVKRELFDRSPLPLCNVWKNPMSLYIR